MGLSRELSVELRPFPAHTNWPTRPLSQVLLRRTVAILPWYGGAVPHDTSPPSPLPARLAAPCAAPCSHSTHSMTHSSFLNTQCDSSHSSSLSRVPAWLARSRKRLDVPVAAHPIACEIVISLHSLRDRHLTP